MVRQEDVAMLRYSVLAAILALGLVGCGGRTPANNNQDGGNVADGPYQLDDGGNIVYDDAGNPIPAQQDAAPGQNDGPLQNDAPAQQDTGATPGIIECGQTTCDADTQQCCISGGGGGGSASCIGLNDTCQGLPISCDGPEDCPSGTPICCATLTMQERIVTCTDQCDDTTLCRLDTDCGTGEKCCGAGSLGSMQATWCEREQDCPNTNPTEGVPCGDATCNAPEVCCVTFNGQSCTSNCNQGLALACDGPEDCSGGDVCCGDIGMGGGGSECMPSGDCQTGMGSGRLCHSNTDCDTGETCTDIPQVNIRICRE
jgi:hypothetical protein